LSLTARKLNKICERTVFRHGQQAAQECDLERIATNEVKLVSTGSVPGDDFGCIAQEWGPEQSLVVLLS
jgi:hypothetical protein